MDATSSAAWMLGPAAILAGAYLMHFQAGLNPWMSLALLGAGLLVFVGLAMIFTSTAPGDTLPLPARRPAPAAEPDDGDNG